MRISYLKGKTYEEVYGKEKAILIKEQRRLNLKKFPRGFKKNHKINLGKKSKLLGKHIHTEESKKKISKKLTILFKGSGNPMYGKKLTLEQRKKLSILMMGKNNWSKGMNHPNYIDGRSFEKYTSEFTIKLKEKIRQRDNYQCQNCNMTEEEHLIVIGQTLPIHHIDYNRKNCDKNNLITLCKQCNSRANYNRVYWEKYYVDKIYVIYKKAEHQDLYNE